MHDSPSDEILVKRACLGDGEAWGIVCVRYSTLVARRLCQIGCSQADIQDLIQEVLLRGYRRLHSFETSALLPWLLGIAFNVLLEHRKKRSIQRRREERYKKEMSVLNVLSPDSPINTVLDKERNLMVAEALGHLQARYREVLVAHLLGGESLPRIAERLGEPRGTISNRYWRARKKLAKLLGGLDITPTSRRRPQRKRGDEFNHDGWDKGGSLP